LSVTLRRGDTRNYTNGKADSTNNNDSYIEQRYRFLLYYWRHNYQDRW